MGLSTAETVPVAKGAADEGSGSLQEKGFVVTSVDAQTGLAVLLNQTP